MLDLLDARPGLKKTLLIGIPAIVLATGLGIWGYQHWARSNALRIARQWLDAGRLDRAGVAIQAAISADPLSPAPWRLASELSWKKGNRPVSVEYARKAALVGRYQVDDVLAWADAAVLADDLQQADEAAGFLDPKTVRESPRALRLEGEIARRDRRFADARDRFQAALEADVNAGRQSPALDEVPLGIACLQTGSAADQARGRELLAKWASNANWGVEALRALLADAMARHEHEAQTRWADALLKNTRVTLGDIPVCLQALAESNPERYQAVLGPLEDNCRSNPTRASQLLGWLTQIGQGAEAVRWGQTLEPGAARKSPIAVGVAESLRATRRWGALQSWVGQADWGRDLDFMGWAYGMVAARELKDGPKADALWQSLHADGALSPAHALFAGDSLYSWGYPVEAADLLWEAAERADLAYQAVGTLARLYQVEGDAAGQYRAFSRLNAMRPSDRRIANNLAYYAALTDSGSLTRIESIAEDNLAHEPGSAVYRSTYAFVLVWSGQASKALSLMEPVSREWRNSPAVAFAYGATLAKLGRKSEAKEVFDSLSPQSLEPRETEWIRSALR